MFPPYSAQRNQHFERATDLSVWKEEDKYLYLVKWLPKGWWSGKAVVERTARIISPSTRYSSLSHLPGPQTDTSRGGNCSGLSKYGVAAVWAAKIWTRWPGLCHNTFLMRFRCWMKVCQRCIQTFGGLRRSKTSLWTCFPLEYEHLQPG